MKNGLLSCKNTLEAGVIARGYPLIYIARGGQRLLIMHISTRCRQL